MIFLGCCISHAVVLGEVMGSLSILTFFSPWCADGQRLNGWEAATRLVHPTEIGNPDCPQKAW